MGDAMLCSGTLRTGRDRCPGGVALHAAQDGHLARIRIPGGRLRAAQLLALAAAGRIGNGLIELTSRANVQVRGLPAGGADDLAEVLATARLLPSATHDRVRNILASPVGGRHPQALAATDAVVDALDAALCRDAGLAELPGRFLFAVDDGGGLALEPTADVTLVARDGDSFRLALAGRTTDLEVPAAAAAATAVAAAHAFLARRDVSGESAWRIAELADGPSAVARLLDVAITGTMEPPARRRLAPGVLTQRDGRRAITALVPLGRLDSDGVMALAALALAHGGELRVGAGRTVTLVDMARGAVEELQTRLATVGLIVYENSGWAGLSACAGLGRCARARLDVAAAATARAAAREPTAAVEHWAACERGCGRRAGGSVAITALADGLRIERDGAEHVVADLDETLAVLT